MNAAGPPQSANCAPMGATQRPDGKCGGKCSRKRGGPSSAALVRVAGAGSAP